jgi:Spy/CpxP family protein refolding chaperone
MHPGFLGYWQEQLRAHRAHGAGHGGRRGWHGHGEHGPHHHPEHGPEHAGPGCGPGACGGRGGLRGRPEWFASPGDEGSGFGVRRPLRFLAHKLELNDEQVTQLATILSALKTERAQAEVDQRRRTAALASAFEGSEFDAAKVDAAEQEQARSAEQLRQSVKSALSQIHALLDDEQRKKFAYLLRTGVLSI